MSSHRETKPLWFIHPRLDAGVYREKLMGSVVKYPDRPIERRIPYKSAKQPRELVDLDPKPLQVRNIKFWTRNIKDAGVSASVNNILDGFVAMARSDSSNTAATVARVWHMDSPGEKFKELLRNKQYFEELFDLLRSNHDQGYFITEMVTLVNLEVTDTTESSNGIGGQAWVPVDPTGSGVVKIGAGARVQASHEKGHSGTYDGEIIVFLGYRLVRLEKVDGARARLRRIVLGQKHGFTVRDGFEYWPEMGEKPVEGNAEPFMSARTPGPEDAGEERQLGEQEIAEEEIVNALGFDVQVVG